MAATISMGQYLFKRVAELGNEHVFGVPGDFNRKSAQESNAIYITRGDAQD
jgi:TPP-dependent 2-oxoacid decarboxylase